MAVVALGTLPTYQVSCLTELKLAVPEGGFVQVGLRDASELNMQPTKFLCSHAGYRMAFHRRPSMLGMCLCVSVCVRVLLPLRLLPSWLILA